MTRDDISKWAREAGVSIRGHYDETGSTPAELQRFAELVAAPERDPELVRDAERYRWLRDPNNIANEISVLNDETPDSYYYTLKCGNELDAAIDAAIERDELKGVAR